MFIDSFVFYLAFFQRRTGIKRPLRLSHTKKFKRPPKFFQNAPFLTFCMGDCKGPCDECRIATMASPPLRSLWTPESVISVILSSLFSWFVIWIWKLINWSLRNRSRDGMLLAVTFLKGVAELASALDVQSKLQALRINCVMFILSTVSSHFLFLFILCNIVNVREIYILMVL
jgi:hypothetical protein